VPLLLLWLHIGSRTNCTTLLILHLLLPGLAFLMLLAILTLPLDRLLLCCLLLLSRAET
jgi:hypothetical protein